MGWGSVPKSTVFRREGGFRSKNCQNPEACSWPSTQHSSCQCCTAMGPVGEELHTQTESHWLLQEGVKKDLSRICWAPLAGEVGGRWSPETRSFLSKLAKAKARSEPPILQRRAEQAWRTLVGDFGVCSSTCICQLAARFETWWRC